VDLLDVQDAQALPDARLDGDRRPYVLALRARRVA